MKTEQLVAALVADRSGSRPLMRSLLLALAAGGGVSLVIFLALFGLRADFVPAISAWRFDLKVALVLLGLVLAVGTCLDCVRPDVSRPSLRRMLLPVVVLALAVAAELALVPAASWRSRLVGSNSLICLYAVPVLSLAPLAVVLFVLRRGAPASPVLAGAAAGLLGALCGAFLYAFHCFDDSPLFVATWYTLAALPVVALGALVGHRLLRW